VQIQSTTYKGTTIKYATVAVCSPAYAVKDGYLIAALSPLEVKDFLDVLARGTIAANADWTFVRGELGMSRPQGIYYGEFRHSMKKMYYLLSLAGSLVTALEAVPVTLDVGKLPSPQQFASHLFGAGATWQITDQGMKAQVFSPTGMEAPVIGLMPLLALASVAAPTLTRVPVARRQVQGAQSAINMRSLLLASLAYTSAHGGRWPPDVDTLIEDRYIDQNLLMNPRSPDRRPGYVYLPPRGPVDQTPPMQLVLYESHEFFGGGINCGFADGHIEFVRSEARFKELLKGLQEESAKQ